MHIVRFAAEDAGTYPSSHLDDGEIGFFADDGTTQHQSGDVSGLGTIYLPKRAAAYGQNAASPETDLDAYDLTVMGDDLIDNAGSSVIVALTAYGQTETIMVSG